MSPALQLLHSTSASVHLTSLMLERVFFVLRFHANVLVGSNSVQFDTVALALSNSNLYIN